MHNSYHIIASIKELTRQIDQLKEVLEKHECNQAERHRHMVTMLEEIYDHTTVHRPTTWVARPTRFSVHRAG